MSGYWQPSDIGVDPSDYLDGEVPVKDDATGLFVPGEPGGGGSVAVDDDGEEVTDEASRLNFGEGLSVTDDGGGAVTIDAQPTALRGPALIEDPDTRLDVIHGLPRVPEQGEIHVQPRSVDHEVERWAVHSEDAGQFTVEVDPAPGAGKEFPFWWLWVPAEPAVAPPFVASVSTYDAAPSATTSVTVDAPDDVEDDDVLVAVLVVDPPGDGGGTFDTSTPPSGWTLLRKQSGSTRGLFEIWTKVAATEPSDYTWSSFVSGYPAAAIMAVRNVNPADPILDETYGQSTGQTATAPSANHDRGVVLFIAAKFNRQSGFTPTAGWENQVTSLLSTPSLPGLGDWAGLGVRSRSFVAEGTTGSVSATWSGGSVSITTHSALVSFNPV